MQTGRYSRKIHFAVSRLLHLNDRHEGHVAQHNSNPAQVDIVVNDDGAINLIRPC